MSLIRRMASSDLRRVAEIHVAGSQAVYSGILPDDRLAALNVEEHTELWETTLFIRKSRTNLVLEENGVLHGWCAIGPARDDDEEPLRTGELYGIYVHPDSHHQGYGTALLTRTHQIFRDRSYHESVLWVVEGNTSARSFYEHRRYIQDSHQRRTTDWMKVPEVRYRRPL